MKRENLFDRYEGLVKQMNVPQSRRKGSGENARWFLRCGMIENRNHPMLLEALSVARDLAQLA